MMLASYLSANGDFIAAEMRGVKAKRSGRESYSEHKVWNKPYYVKVLINETEEKIIEALYEDCLAAPGGCKHIRALISWRHCRSEEPSTTELKCYWRKSTLSKIDNELKFVKARDMGPSVTSLLLPQMTIFSLTEVHSDIDNNFNNFVLFCKSSITTEICNEAFNMTKDQADCPLWFELRYGRITASKAHEISQCKKVNGVLVDVVPGATKIRRLNSNGKKSSIGTTCKQRSGEEEKIKIKKCGLIINKYPLLDFTEPPEQNSFSYSPQQQTFVTPENGKEILKGSTQWNTEAGPFWASDNHHLTFNTPTKTYSSATKPSRTLFISDNEKHEHREYNLKTSEHRENEEIDTLGVELLPTTSPPEFVTIVTKRKVSFPVGSPK
ncbi:hypothetical protein FQA39_LY17004 [Lamprigera yunnana]|nr:hypothetical protein FQA39_LY17004 [Lamprigera yunnana]